MYSEQKSTPITLELAPAIPLFPDNIHQLLRSYGPLDSYRTQDGGQITVLPTCCVALNRLHANSWEVPINVGNSRLIKYIKSPAVNNDGLFVKSPERVFTQDLSSLYQGDIWYGGNRSGQRPLRLHKNPLVEEQTLYEALFLLELHAIGIPAEIPQAILLNRHGEYSLVTQEIPTTSLSVNFKGPQDWQLLELVRQKTTLIPGDYNRSNFLEDLNGQLHIIDVNRWLWPPHTDDYLKKLQTEIITAIQTLQKSPKIW